ncbi:hypothetical protein [Planosporangium flavigriseum]|uniref:hypothetical protein n=1 Tax=Planosporangium flavigriseum TaxID=373681 RepID=UPI0019515AFD|nr:hypothetical protein [Planosporangium flavigriseum]
MDLGFGRSEVEGLSIDEAEGLSIDDAEGLGIGLDDAEADTADVAEMPRAASAAAPARAGFLERAVRMRMVRGPPRLGEGMPDPAGVDDWRTHTHPGNLKWTDPVHVLRDDRPHAATPQSMAWGDECKHQIDVRRTASVRSDGCWSLYLPGSLVRVQRVRLY